MLTLKGIDPTNLYQVTTLTDFKTGEILIYDPISLQVPDTAALPTLFFGKTHLQSNNGPVTVQFPIEASSLDEALEKWLPSLQAKLEEIQGQALRSQLLNGAIVKGN